MQNNPKYREEALFLIRHFQALDSALQDLPAYLADARSRSESQHVPVLEVTIRGVLAAGTLTAEQEQTLRTHASEIGVSESTFERVLAKVVDEQAAALEPVRSLLENSEPLPLDPSHSSASGASPQLLADVPVARAMWEDGQRAQLVVDGAHARELHPSRSRGTDPMLLDVIEVHNLGDEPMPGEVSSNVPWLAEDPERLDPSARTQSISVQVDPDDIPPDARMATVQVQTHDGQHHTVVYAIKRGPPFGAVVGAVLILFVLGVAAATAAWAPLP